LEIRVKKMEYISRLTLLGFILMALAACESSAPPFEEGEADENLLVPNISGGPVTSAHIEWDIPEFRENGDSMGMSEIAGYEILFRKTDEDIFYSVSIEDQNTMEYTLTDIPVGEYEFMISVFDTNGLYSEFSEPAIANLSES